ncbi:MAG: hypothetical protein AAFW84_30885 [Cyanobacteria bacterium J06635_15]
MTIQRAECGLEYSQDKAEVYERYDFTVQGSIGSKDWEVFAAILLNDRARSGDGADLMNYEVKSAVMGNSFEYQYHRNHGLEKLADDKSVDHIFIARNKTYTDIEVWLVERSKMQPVFDRWLPDLRKNYESETRQRFRRSVTYGFVRDEGSTLLRTSDGVLTAFLESI